MAGFSEGMQAGHLIAQDTMDLFNTGYNVYQDQRNFNYQQGVFDYQKALQQQIFDREDTAVQRRRKDLEAAGLNPNLAAGSAAGAGAVVGVSSGPGDHNISRANLLQNYGAYLDAKKAAEEAKQAEYMTNFLRGKSENLLNDQANQKTLEQIQHLFDSGVNPEGYWIINSSDRQDRPTIELANADWPGAISYPGGKWFGDYGITGFGKHYTVTPLSESRYWKSLQNGWTIQLNDLATSNFDTAMLAREEEWQTSDKWLDRGLRIWDRITNSGSALGNMIRAVRPNKKPMRKSSTTFGKGFRNTTFEY